jgi:hypothetical protein
VIKLDAERSRQGERENMQEGRETIERGSLVDI